MGLTGTVIAASDGPREAAGRFIKCRRGLEGGVMETLACSGAEPLPPRRRDRARLPVPGPGATPGGGRAPLPPPPAPSPTSASSVTAFSLLWAVFLFLSIHRRLHGVGMQQRESDLS